MGNWGRALGGGAQAGSNILERRIKDRQWYEEFMLKEQMHMRSVDEALMQAAVESMYGEKQATHEAGLELENLKRAEKARRKGEGMAIRRKFKTGQKEIKAEVERGRRGEYTPEELETQRRTEAMETSAAASTLSAQASMKRAVTDEAYSAAMIGVNQQKDDFMGTVSNMKDSLMPGTLEHIKGLQDQADMQFGNWMMTHPNDPTAPKVAKELNAEVRKEGLEAALKDAPITDFMRTGTIRKSIVETIFGLPQKEGERYLAWLAGTNETIYIETLRVHGDRELLEKEMKRLGILEEAAKTTLFEEATPAPPWKPESSIETAMQNLVTDLKKQKKEESGSP